MKLSYERDLSHNYMIPETENADEAENWQIQMLAENQISGLLRCTVKKVNCKNRYYYDITSRQSLAQIYEIQELQIREIKKLLGCLYRTLRETENYLLDAERIVLDPQCIYMDVETEEAWFCYLPEYHADLEEAFRRLTSWFLCHLDQQDFASVLQGYELYRKAREQQGGIQELLRLAMAFPEENAGYSREGRGRQDAEGRCWQGGRQQTTSTQETGETQKRTEKGPDGSQKENGKTSGEKRKAPVLFKKTGWISAVILLVIAAATIVGVWAKILTVTQAGEITFLAAGLAAYGVSVRKKKQKEEQSGQGDQAYRREQKAEQERKKREKRMRRKQKQIAKKGEEPKPGRIESVGRDNTVQQTGEEPQKVSPSVTDPIGATTLLWEGTEDYEPRLTLISMNSRDRQSVVLMNDSYLIGKLKAKVDVWINDPAVSRIHAKIQKEGEDYFLQDLNATNGTFLNGRRLDVQEKVRIQAGDEITFAETGYYVGKC